MQAILDLIIINFSAFLAFLFRQHFGDLIIKQPPSLYWQKYAWVLLYFNFLCLFVFWILGLYDKRQKRALLEEIALIFGVMLIAMAILIVILFTGRLWWMSRTILFLFLINSVVLLSFVRVFINKKPKKQIKLNLKQIEQNMKDKNISLNEKVSIIIVCYNSLSKLEKCLKSTTVSAFRNELEIIKVDNNSTDGTAKFVEEKYLNIKLLKNNTNLGYTKAVNQGLKASKSEFNLILNSDIVVLPGAIEIMLKYMINHPRVGIAGCRLFNEDGTLQYSVRRFLDLRTYLYRFTPIRGLMAGSALERYYLMQDWDHKDNRFVDWVLGGCMMVKKEAINEVGMMDENIFLYFDDVDWCYRMWEKDWQIAYVADAAMIHKHERTSANKIFNRATREHFKSLFYFIRKYGFRIPTNCPSSQE